MGKSKVAQSAGARNLKVARKVEPAHVTVAPRFYLSLDECPHGVQSLSFMAEHGGRRLTSSKHCGQYREVRRWRVDPREIAESILAVERDTLRGLALDEPTYRIVDDKEPTP